MLAARFFSVAIAGVVFLSGCRTSKETAAASPLEFLRTGPIAVGDSLVIRNERGGGEFICVVSQDGSIKLPLNVSIEVVGLTTEQVAAAIEARFQPPPMTGRRLTVSRVR